MARNFIYDFMREGDRKKRERRGNRGRQRQTETCRVIRDRSETERQRERVNPLAFNIDTERGFPQFGSKPNIKIFWTGSDNKDGMDKAPSQSILTGPTSEISSKPLFKFSLMRSTALRFATFTKNAIQLLKVGLRVVWTASFIFEYSVQIWHG